MLDCITNNTSNKHTRPKHKLKTNVATLAASALLRFVTLFLEDGVVPLSAAASRKLSNSAARALYAEQAQAAAAVKLMEMRHDSGSDDTSSSRSSDSNNSSGRSDRSSDSNRGSRGRHRITQHQQQQQRPHDWHSRMQSSAEVGRGSCCFVLLSLHCGTFPAFIACLE